MKNEKKYKKSAFFLKNICKYQIKVVPLHRKQIKFS